MSHAEVQQMQVNTEDTPQIQSEVTETSPVQETQTPVERLESQGTQTTENVSETNSQSTFESKVENCVTQQQVNTDTFVGQVKWFYNRLGYGFITIITPGDRFNNDIFVHQQHINPKTSDYRSLQQGEYVSFRLGAADSDSEIQKDGHPHQAIAVTGVFGGSLLCDQIPRREMTTTTFSGPRTNYHRQNFRSNRSRKFSKKSHEDSDEGEWKKVGLKNN